MSFNTQSLRYLKLNDDSWGWSCSRWSPRGRWKSDLSFCTFQPWKWLSCHCKILEAKLKKEIKAAELSFFLNHEWRVFHGLWSKKGVCLMEKGDGGSALRHSHPWWFFLLPFISFPLHPDSDAVVSRSENHWKGERGANTEGINYFGV